MANPFKAIRMDNRATAKLLRKDTRGDFRVTQAGLSAIIGNALTTQRGMGSQLTRQNERTLAAMTRTSNRSNKKLSGIVTGAHSSIAGGLSSAIAGDPNAFRDLLAGAKAGTIRNTAQVKTGGALSSAGNQSMDLLRQGVKGDAASAKFALAQALSGRTNEDQTRIAEMQTQLASQRLQYQLDMKKAEQDAEYNERYLRLQAKLANGGGSGTGKGPSDNAVTAGGTLADYINTPGPTTKDDAGNDVPGSQPTYDAANAHAAALILQYGLKGADALRLYNQVDTLYGQPLRSAADLGLGPAHADSTTSKAPGDSGTTTTTTKNGKTVTAPTPPGGIPYGEDPNKPWENVLKDGAKTQVAAAVEVGYNQMAQEAPGGDVGAYIQNASPDSRRERLKQILGIHEYDGVNYIRGDGTPFNKGTKLSDEQYNAYLSYGAALLKIRTDIGGYQNHF